MPLMLGKRDIAWHSASNKSLKCYPNNKRKEGVKHSEGEVA